MMSQPRLFQHHTGTVVRPINLVSLLESWSGCRDLNPGPLAPQASNREPSACRAASLRSERVARLWSGSVVAQPTGSGPKLVLVREGL